MIDGEQFINFILSDDYYKQFLITQAPWPGFELDSNLDLWNGHMQCHQANKYFFIDNSNNDTKRTSVDVGLVPLLLMLNRHLHGKVIGTTP